MSNVKLRKRCKCGCRWGVAMPSATWPHDERLICKNCFEPQNIAAADAMPENSEPKPEPLPASFFA